VAGMYELRVPLKISEKYYQHSTNLRAGVLWALKPTWKDEP
jgi:hypothetical protein